MPLVDEETLTRCIKWVDYASAAYSTAAIVQPDKDLWNNAQEAEDLVAKLREILNAERHRRAA